LAQAIEDAATFSISLFHPNHLIYNAFGYLLFRAAHWVGLNIRALQVLQFCNAVFSILAAALLFRILSMLLADGKTRLLFTALFVFSATWWRFSVDADAYIVSVLFLLICAGELLVKERPNIWVLGLCCSAPSALAIRPLFDVYVLRGSEDLPTGQQAFRSTSIASRASSRVGTGTESRPDTRRTVW